MRSRGEEPLPTPRSRPARQETCLDRLSPGKESRDQRPERVSEPQHWLLSLPLGLAEGLTPSVPAAQPQRLSRPLGAQGPSLIPFQDEPWLWGEKLVSGGTGQGSPTPSHRQVTAVSVLLLCPCVSTHPLPLSFFSSPHPELLDFCLFTLFGSTLFCLAAWLDSAAPSLHAQLCPCGNSPSGPSPPNLQCHLRDKTLDGDPH